uniref:Uncharacterized protein n=1 Tax=Panagrolaimus sp. JU765 TaxID=591449 RepID=A0AC34RRU9_9BILA
MRKAFERDIPDLKETILEQRFEQDVEFPTNIVFESANDFFKRPNPFTRFQLQLACQKYNPTFVLKKLSMMLAGKGRSWFLQQLEALHFSSLKAEILAKRVEASLEELVLNEAFCASLDNLHDEISLQNSVNLAENISRLLTEQKEAAVDFYYPQHFRIFAEQFVDGFDAESCGSRVHCNRNLTLQLEAALRKEFDYGQIHSVR